MNLRARALVTSIAIGSVAICACSSGDAATADGGAGGATILGKAGASGTGGASTGGAAGTAGKAGTTGTAGKGGASGTGGASVGGASGKAGSGGTAGSGAAAGSGTAGTAGSGGKACGFCVPGDTQPCTGPGACKGGQGCKDDGCGWKTCDCGTAGASGSTMGTGGTGAAGMTTGAGGATTGTGGGTTALYCPIANPGSPVILGTGSAGMSGGMLDLHQAAIFDNPPNLADWPITTMITEVDIGDNVHVTFDKQDGPNKWPDIVPPGWDGPLQYTLGMAEYIDGQWVASAAIEFWYGLAASGGNITQDYQVACNWYYDGRWGPLEKHQPVPGQIIGLFVVAGNLRGVKDGSQSPVMERSNVVLFPMPGPGGGTFNFLGIFTRVGTRGSSGTSGSGARPA